MRNNRRKRIGVLGESRTSEALGKDDPRWRRAQQMRAVDGTGTGLEVDPKTRQAGIKATRLGAGPQFAGLQQVIGSTPFAAGSSPTASALAAKQNETLEALTSLRDETTQALEALLGRIEEITVTLQEAGILKR